MKILRKKFSSNQLNKSQLSEIKGGTPASECRIRCVLQGGGPFRLRKCIASCSNLDLPIE